MFMSAVAVAVKGGMRSNVLLCRARSADRGGGAERRRGSEIGEVADFSALWNCREVVLRLWMETPSALTSHSPYLAAVAATQGETLRRFPPLRVICGCGMSQRLERSNVLLCRAWSADRGGGAERRRGWEKESTLQLWQPCRKAASRLTVNPFGSDEPLPLYRAGAAIQGETLPVAVCHFL